MRCSSPRPRTGPRRPRPRWTCRVHLQAPTTLGKEPTASAVCTLSSFALQLVGDDYFIRLNVTKIEFSMVAAGKKPDVNVDFREGNGIEFAGAADLRQHAARHHPVRRVQRPALPRRHRRRASRPASTWPCRPSPSASSAWRTSRSAPTSASRSSTSRSTSGSTSAPGRTRSASPSWLFGGGGFFGDHAHARGVRDPRGGLRVRRRRRDRLRGGQRRRSSDGRHLLPAGERGNAELTGYFRLRGEVDVLGPDLGVASSSTSS